MYWALKSAGVAPGNSSARVWADYAGVWHMTEAWSLRLDADATLGLDSRAEVVYSIAAGVQYSF